MKKLIILSLFLLTAHYSNAQRYENAIGLRGGYGSGISYKHNMGDFTVEAIGAFRSYYSYFGVLGELYSPLEVDLPGDFNLYYGGGAHFINLRSYVGAWAGTRTSYNYFGLDGILGVEYEIPDYPLDVSIDIKPELNFSGYGFGWGSAFSVRYEF